MKEFRIAKGWRIFSFIFVAALLIGGLLLINRSFAPLPPGSKTGLLVLGIIFLPLAVYLYLEVSRACLTIDEYAMTQTNAFSSRSIALKDIAGFRRGEKKSIYVVPKEGGKQMRISNSLERRDELVEWLEEKYPDVDAIEFEAETKNLLENDQFGATKEDREANLAKARKIAGISTSAAFVLLVWSFIYPVPYQLVVLLLIAAPWAGVYATWHFKGLMKLTKKKSSPYPTMIALMGLPVFGVVLNALIRYNLYSFPQSASVLLTIVTILLAGVCIRAFSEVLQDKGSSNFLIIGCIILAVAIYSFGSIVLTNCYYDHSTPERYRVQVSGKRVAHGKSTTYYLSVTAWGRFTEGHETSVSNSLYNAVEVNDSLSVYLWQGRWEIPWYRLVRQ